MCSIPQTSNPCFHIRRVSPRSCLPLSTVLEARLAFPSPPSIEVVWLAEPYSPLSGVLQKPTTSSCLDLEHAFPSYSKFSVRSRIVHQRRGLTRPLHSGRLTSRCTRSDCGAA